LAAWFFSRTWVGRFLDLLGERLKLDCL